MPPLNHTARLSALALFAGVCGPALAQVKTPPAAGEAPSVLESIVVTGSRARARDLAGSATYLDAEALATFAYSDVNRVLRQAPGVTLQEEDGFGLRPNIGIRGSGSDRAGRVAIMEDGILIAPAPYAAPAAYYFPRLARMSGVEVVKGPAAIKYGPLTTGGALQMFSTPIPETAGRLGGKAELLGGSHGGGRAHMAVGGWAGPEGGPQIGGLVEGLHERSDGFKTLDSGGDSGFAITDWVFKLGARTGEAAALPQSLEIKHQRYKEVSDETYLGLTLADFRARPYRRYRASMVDRLDVKHTTWQATHRVALGADLDLTTLAYVTRTQRAWYKLNDVASGGSLRAIATVLADPATFAEGYATLVGDPAFTSAANALRVRNNARRYDARGVQSVLSAKLATGPLTHRLEISARYHRDEEDRFQQDDRYRMAAGRMVLTTAGAPGSQDNRLGEAAAWAFFLRDTVTAGRLSVTAGLRRESIKTRRLDYALGDAVRAAPAASIDAAIGVWIPGLAATYDLTPELMLLAGAHRGFSNPAPGSTTDAETSWNHEAGFRYARGGASLEAIGFFNAYGNLVGTCTGSTGGECAIGAQFDGGAVDVKGLEVTAAYDLGPALGLTVGLPVSLVYTHTDAKFKTSFISAYEPWGNVTAGFELPYQPKRQLTLNLGVHGEGWRLDASANRVSRTRAAAGAGPIPAGRKVDGRTLIDLSAEYDISDQVAAFVQVQNLTDQVYNVGFAPAGARPGAPRLAMGGVKMRF